MNNNYVGLFLILAYRDTLFVIVLVPLIDKTLC